MTRRQMTPREVVETLLRSQQLHVTVDELGFSRAIVRCKRTGKEITLENVGQIEVEHWPKAHAHGGKVLPANAMISLAEGHAEHTKRERKQSAKERRLKVARLAKADVEKRLSNPKWRLKRKMSGEVVKVRTR